MPYSSLYTDRLRNGHDFLGPAEVAGATAAVLEDPHRTRLPSLVVREGRAAAALVAAAAYRFPATVLRRAIGVTGTNGKSTTVSLLRHLFNAPEAPAASIGTVGVFVGSAGRALDGGGGLTTPGPIELQRIIRELVDQGVRTLALEASSHSLDQQRIGSIAFDAAIFTNLTRDHLDYHRTMEAYLAAKAQLLTYLRPGGVAVVNVDDPAWRALPATAQTVRFSALSRCQCTRARRALRSARQHVATGNRSGTVLPCAPSAHRRLQRGKCAGRGGGGVGTRTLTGADCPAFV